MTDKTPKNQVLLQAIGQACAKHGIRYSLLSDDWILHLVKGDQEHFICGYAFDFNSQTSSDLALDKVATYLLLKDRELPAVPHHLLLSVSRPYATAWSVEQLFAKYRAIVIKPLKGSGGELVARFDNPVSAQDFINNQCPEIWTAAPFIDVDYELRLVMWDDEILLAYEKHEPAIVNDLKMFNLRLGAHPHTIAPHAMAPDIKLLAQGAMQALGLRLAAVDVVFDEHGAAKILEINSTVTLEHYAHFSAANHKKVLALYELLIQKLFAI